MVKDKNVNIENATVSVLLTIDEEMYLVAVENDVIEVIELLTKKAAKHVIPTGKTAKEFLDFVGYNKEGE